MTQSTEVVLPELPPCVHWIPANAKLIQREWGMSSGRTEFFTADQMRDFARQAVLEERAATAKWDDNGAPLNGKAAAADAVLWLDVLRRAAALLRIPPDDLRNLFACRDALAAFVNGEPIRPQTTKSETQ